MIDNSPRRYWARIMFISLILYPPALFLLPMNLRILLGFPLVALAGTQSHLWGVGVATYCTLLLGLIAPMTLDPANLVMVSLLYFISSYLSAQGSHMFRHMNQTIAREGEFNQMILRTMNDLLVVWDYQGRIIHFNEASQLLSGYSAKEVLGRTVEEIFIPEDEQATVSRILQQALNTGLAIEHTNHWVAGDGSHHLIRWKNLPIDPAAQPFGGVLSIGQDISEQHAMQEQMQASEARFSGLIEGLEAIIFTLDSDDRLGYVSPYLSELTGYTPEEWMGTPLEQWIDAEDRADLSSYLADPKQSFPDGLVCHLLDAKGFDHALRLNLTPQASGQSLGILTDITRILDLQEMLWTTIEEQRRLTDIVDRGPTVVFQWADSDEYPILYVSRNVWQFGYDPIELMQTRSSYLNLVHPEDREAMVERFASYRADAVSGYGSGEFSHEYRIVTRDGRVRWVDERSWLHLEPDGQIRHYQGLILDITPRKTTEMELQHQQQWLRVALESIGDGILTTDSLGRINFMNPRAEAMTDWSLPRAYGLLLDAVLPLQDPRTGDTGFNPAWTVLRTGEGFQHPFESLLTTPTGEQRYIEHTSAPIPTPDGKIDGVIIALRDITRRHRQAEQLRRSEEQFRLISEQAQDIIYRIQLHPEFRFEYVSPSVTTLTGYTPEEHYQDVDLAARIVHPDDRPLLQNLQSMPPEGSTVELRWVTRDGRVLWTEQKNTPLFDEQGRIIALQGIARDITERKQLEEQLRYLSEHDSLTGLNNRAYFERKLDELDQPHHAPLSLLMVDLNGLKLVNDTFGHPKGDRLLQSVARILESELRPGDVLSRWGGDEFIFILPDTAWPELEDLAQRIRNAFDEEHVESMPVGIALGGALKKDPNEDIRTTLRRAEERMYRNKMLESHSSRHALISSLRTSLWESDQETEEHAQRLEDLSRQLGQRVGLTYNQLDELSLLSQLHDIGKIAISNEILWKPEPLSDEEWQMIKRHPEIGYRIAQTSPELLPISEAILSHHERWDGSGYPRELRQTEIPITARILTIVDAYDVMTTGRPYRPASSSEEAAEELKRCAGTQFDPELVEHFLDTLRDSEGVTIREQPTP